MIDLREAEDRIGTWRQDSVIADGLELAAACTRGPRPTAHCADLEVSYSLRQRPNPGTMRGRESEKLERKETAHDNDRNPPWPTRDEGWRALS